MGGAKQNGGKELLRAAQEMKQSHLSLSRLKDWQGGRGPTGHLLVPGGHGISAARD